MVAATFAPRVFQKSAPPKLQVLVAHLLRWVEFWSLVPTFQNSKSRPRGEWQLAFGSINHDVLSVLRAKDFCTMRAEHQTRRSPEVIAGIEVPEFCRAIQKCQKFGDAGRCWRSRDVLTGGALC